MNEKDLAIKLAKQMAGQAAAHLIQDEMLVGIGSGSTAACFIEALGQRCQEGLRIQAVSSSQLSEQLAAKFNIPLIDSQSISFLDITVDGADEIDPQKNMIKGGGGALLREKLLAQSSDEMVVIVDESKLVDHLGHFPVPVEIAPFAYQTTILRLERQGYQGKLRCQKDQSPYLTDNQHYIFDIYFNHPILNPKEEHDKLKAITGVIETGLFFKIAGRVIVGYYNGTIIQK